MLGHSEKRRARKQWRVNHRALCEPSVRTKELSGAQRVHHVRAAVGRVGAQDLHFAREQAKEVRHLIAITEELLACVMRALDSVRHHTHKVAVCAHACTAPPPRTPRLGGVLQGECARLASV